MGRSFESNCKESSLLYRILLLESCYHLLFEGEGRNCNKDLTMLLNITVDCLSLNTRSECKRLEWHFLKREDVKVNVVTYTAEPADVFNACQAELCRHCINRRLPPVSKSRFTLS